MMDRKIFLIAIVIAFSLILTSCYERETYVSKRGDKEVETAFDFEDQQEVEDTDTDQDVLEIEYESRSDIGSTAPLEEQDSQSPNPPLAIEDQVFYISTIDGLSIHEHPSSSSTILARLNQGHKVIYKGLVEAEGLSWLELETLDNISGYALFEYLRLEEGNVQP